jgi:hypothetical protein
VPASSSDDSPAAAAPSSRSTRTVLPPAARFTDSCLHPSDSAAKCTSRLRLPY